MRYVGLDVHWRQSTFCVLDENGRKQRSRTIRGSWDRVLAEIAKVKRPFTVCFEASTGYGYLYERLGKMAQRVAVAHPGQLRLIFRSKRKNDRVDAEKLAKLLYLDEVPPVYVPSADVRAWRAMIEHRSRMVQKRTRAKNALRALLRAQGIQAPRGLWSRKGLAWLGELTQENRLDALRRDMLMEEIGSLCAMLERVGKELDRMAEEHPGVRLLRTVPGVGIRTAEAVMAYIDDPGRFHSNKAIGGYFGMVPCQDASAGRSRLGHITREGSATVRRLVTEAAWQSVRRSEKVRAYFRRVMRDDPGRRKIAVVAVGHYLLRVMLAMLQSGEVWREAA